MGFSTVWKIIFHSVEKFPKVCRSIRQASLARRVSRGAIDLAFALRLTGSGSALGYFPLCGKIAESFSMVWKYFPPIFFILHY